MLPGYNHNICYKGQIFHIQTEDSGVKYPHVITLLFVKGNIVARKKKDYTEAVGFERMEEVVRELMQDQHKDMLRELKSGVHDRFLGGAPGKEEEAVCAAPEAPAKPAAPRPGVPAPPPPPARALRAEDFVEKPAAKTITISEDQEIKDEDIFGADLISDKSLDEVILSFLSKQMDEDDG
ncbi:MAG TPA: hypothetical protein VM658_13840 [bacterium]|nr:hypothetical protein [bacterium]